MEDVDIVAAIDEAVGELEDAANAAIHSQVRFDECDLHKKRKGAA
jgi:hypothetical protein